MSRRTQVDLFIFSGVLFTSRTIINGKPLSTALSQIRKNIYFAQENHFEQSIRPPFTDIQISCHVYQITSKNYVDGKKMMPDGRYTACVHGPQKILTKFSCNDYMSLIIADLNSHPLNKIHVIKNLG